MANETCWYAVRTKPNREYVVSEALVGKGYEVFLPLAQKRPLGSRPAGRGTESPLFPSYLFCRFDVSNRLPILTISGVHQIVGCGKSPIPVDEEEIESLKTIIRECLALEDHPHLAIGQEVVVCDGPLAGAHGKVVNINGVERFAVSITLLQRTVSVEMNPRWLMSASRTLATGV